MKFFLSICCAVLVGFSFPSFAQIPVQVLVQISKAEDELRFDKTLEDLMKNADAKIRIRATLAAGRIGNEIAIPALREILESDSDVSTRATAAFALGEIESVKGADAILKALENTKNTDEIRARAVEAAGKIAAANLKDEKSKTLSKAILDTLDFEKNRGKQRAICAVSKRLRRWSFPSRRRGALRRRHPKHKARAAGGAGLRRARENAA